MNSMEPLVMCHLSIVRGFGIPQQRGPLVTAASNADLTIRLVGFAMIGFHWIILTISLIDIHNCDTGHTIELLLNSSFFKGGGAYFKKFWKTNLDEIVKSRRIVMPDLIRHSELPEITGFRLSPE